MATKRNPAAMEARRIEGARLLRAKAKQADVARALGVSRQTVSTWAQQLGEARGAVGKLKARPLGRPRRLDAQQCARRAGDRAPEAAHRAWARRRASRQGRTIVFVDESGLSEKCPLRRTSAPRGQAPVIQQGFTWRSMSAIAGLSWWRFYLRFFPGAMKSEQVIEFLGALQRHIGTPLPAIGDGVGMHKSRRVREWLERQAGRTAVAFLPCPPYAPELDPVQGDLGVPREARDRQPVPAEACRTERLRAPATEVDAAAAAPRPRLCLLATR